jgi:protein-tyrosine-phosphatase
MYGDNPLEFENMSAKEFVLKLIDNFDLVLFLTRRNIKEHTESNGGKISIIDTFNLHRRPGWCYEKLIER